MNAYLVVNASALIAILGIAIKVAWFGGKKVENSDLLAERVGKLETTTQQLVAAVANVQGQLERMNGKGH